ncbi:hypothetical protein BEN47_07695 [Hymenobacter lapidarius]|uniref:SMP-30/Gluconolactonase/LRE-like region domain-containing protein n=1 Tax=Hymenobacter lapidarius TaxID=1908237 RepID=A0A1G1TEG7_9BACT|nr:hypothetical protein BEN47_07695 [Hymenobacter lapidarius]
MLSSCSDDDDAVTTPAAPATITFTQAGLYPEGVQYDAPNKRFLVTSLATGKIGQVQDDGTYSLFADNPALVSTIGLHIDGNLLLVAVSDPGANPARTSPATQRKMAHLAIYNRDTPSNTPVVLDLDAASPNHPNHFANDIAVDAQGNAYVTDSFAPVIYKVTPNRTVTVFLDNTQLTAPAGMFGLNGIVYHPDGYLLVAKSDNGAIYKVPLNNPAGFTQVAISQNLAAADGLLLQDNNTLQVVSNAQARVFRLVTTNGFTAATLSGTFVTQPQFPTTLARRDGTSYVLYANLDALFSGRTPAVSQYSINRVDF